MGYKPNQERMTGRFVAHAPNVARVARGLELLETAEKVEAIRATGFMLDYVDHGNFYLADHGQKRINCEIKGMNNPHTVIAFCRERTQHAATLAAIAAYEAEFGEVAV